MLSVLNIVRDRLPDRSRRHCLVLEVAPSGLHHSFVFSDIPSQRCKIRDECFVYATVGLNMGMKSAHRLSSFADAKCKYTYGLAITSHSSQDEYTREGNQMGQT